MAEKFRTLSTVQAILRELKLNLCIGHLRWLVVWTAGGVPPSLSLPSENERMEESASRKKEAYTKEDSNNGDRDSDTLQERLAVKYVII